MAPNFEQYRTRVFRYSLVDGTVEIGLGLFALVWSGLVLWSVNRSVDLTWYAVVFGAIALLSILLNYGTELIRHHLTYPRTGYIRPHGRRGGFLTALLAGAILAVAMAFLTVRNPSNIRLLCGATGLVIGAALFYKGWTLQVPRLSILAVAAIAAGLIVPFFLLELPASAALLFGILGAALLVSGVLTLLAYARNNPRPEDTGA